MSSRSSWCDENQLCSDRLVGNWHSGHLLISTAHRRSLDRAHTSFARTLGRSLSDRFLVSRSFAARNRDPLAVIAAHDSPGRVCRNDIACHVQRRSGGSREGTVCKAAPETAHSVDCYSTVTLFAKLRG